MNSALDALIREIPDTIEAFESGEFPLPVINALYNEVPEVFELKGQASKLSSLNLADGRRSTKEIEKILHVSLALGEAIESRMGDKRDFYIPFRRFRSQVFRVKRSPGWALVLGNADQTEIITRLKERRFNVFSTFPHPKAHYLGNRDTSIIYFLQNQVRYAMVYGRIEPGDPHEIAHYLEEDGPGIIIVNGKQTETESLLTLGCMLMGTPAVVPSSFPYLYGNRRIADSPDEIVRECMKFPNLRVIEHEGLKIQLPDYCNPANLREKVNVETTLGGTELSFLAVRKADAGDGIEVIGTPDRHLGVLIESGFENMDDFAFMHAAECLEKIAAALPNHIKGVTSSILEGYKNVNRPFHVIAQRVGTAEPALDSLKLGLAKDVKITGEMIAQTIHDGLRKQYPRLDRLKVTVIFDEVLLKEKKMEIASHKAERERILASTTEDNMKEFYSCVGCQPFAREHVCVVTPERPPQCGRHWRLMLVGAYLNPEDAPDPLSRRKRRFSSNAFSILKKGKTLDSKKGEWTGVNEGVFRESGGKINRVQIHSITGGFPHSSCSCFGYLVFHILEVDGIGIMKSTFEGQAPNGMTWDLLTSKASGKQMPGICGVSLNYLRSPKFLQGDGGYSRVVWADRKTLDLLRDVIPPKFKIATEKDATNMTQLRGFLANRKQKAKTPPKDSNHGVKLHARKEMSPISVAGAREENFSRKVLFKEAFPEIKHLTVRTEERGYSPACTYFTKPDVRQYNENSLVEHVKCSNPVCCDGGFSMGDIVKQVLGKRMRHFETTVTCQGYEGSHRIENACPNNWKINLEIEYRKRPWEE